MTKNEVREFLLSLHGKPEADFGCAREEVQKRIDDAYYHYPDKRVSVVADWKWVNIQLTEKEKKVFPTYLMPAFLFADKVLQESPYRGIDWVRTTLLMECHYPRLFVTKNTCYVLVGRGTKCSLSVNVASNVFI